MKYPAHFEADHELGGYVVTFRDIPEAITQGNTLETATCMAKDVLVSSMDFYFDDKRPVPMPSAPQPGEYLIELPTSLSAKILLLNEMLAQNVRPADLAKKMNTRPQDINRLIDLKHTTKIDAIAAAVNALGKNLELRIL